ncbi:MAG TPA: methylated-DNA--[protein]-cysteine S-methyltransferase [Candidatus Saccharimonadales bacterium]|jgi:O-6-methylguanine DNA methyltransferase|nr:methylated-DNA--[protein]-cysteine S-methyltransferase [Candidatus Saccharimonadales bacterium]
MEYLITKIFNRKIMIVGQGQKVVAVCFNNQSDFSRYLKSSTENDQSVALNNLKNQLSEYETGSRKQFDIKMLLSGTKFQQQVWGQISRIPYGQKMTYLEVAKAISKPRSYRAVANAIGKNPIAIVIPCHRVLKSNGDLGGYSSGIDIKKLLLQKENINYNQV